MAGMESGKLIRMGASPQRHWEMTPVQGASLGVVTTCVVLVALALGRGVLAPLALALLVALALAPLVRWLARVLPRSVAAALVVLALAGVTIGTVYSLTDEAAAVVDRMPSMVRQLRQAVQAASQQQGVFAQFQRAMTELQQLSTANGAAIAAPPPIDITRGVLVGTRDAAAFAAQAILLLFLVYFLLATGNLMKAKLIRVSGARLSRRNLTEQVIDQIGDQVGRFVSYLAVSGVLVGVLTWLSFAAMGMAYPGLWGLGAGLLNCLPYAGPTVVLIGSFAAALAQFHDPGWAAAVAGVSLAITSLEGLVLAPVLFGRWSRINPVTVFVAVMFWTWMWGPIGALLALPILVSMKAVADAVPDFSAVSELIADR